MIDAVRRRGAESVQAPGDFPDRRARRRRERSNNVMTSPTVGREGAPTSNPKEPEHGA
jgi:hypothetical protein